MAVFFCFMLRAEVAKKIEDFVFLKPRSIDEIAKHIGKNWRTANRYIEQIMNEQGTISVRIFREGTRGALKVVFWTNIDKIHSSAFQEKLFHEIINGKNKFDFSPFNIYQHVPERKKHAFTEQLEEEYVTANQDLIGLLRQAKKQVLLFSGNLSWANFKQGKTRLIEIFKELTKKKINIKILTRVELDGFDNIKKFLDINNRTGKENIEIRHREHPLRAVIIDDKVISFKEIKDPKNYNKEELKKKTFIFYRITDKNWIEWLSKIFWNMFSNAIPAEKRMNEIEKIQKL